MEARNLPALRANGLHERFDTAGWSILGDPVRRPVLADPSLTVEEVGDGLDGSVLEKEMSRQTVAEIPARGSNHTQICGSEIPSHSVLRADDSPEIA